MIREERSGVQGSCGSHGFTIRESLCSTTRSRAELAVIPDGN